MSIFADKHNSINNVFTKKIIDARKKKRYNKNGANAQ